MITASALCSEGFKTDWMDQRTCGDVSKLLTVKRHSILPLRLTTEPDDPSVNTAELWIVWHSSEAGKRTIYSQKGLNVEVNSDAKMACPWIARVASYLKLGVSLPPPPFCSLPSDSKHWRGWR